MGHRVGTKGQVVIEKRIRDQIGIEPGWRALQRVVDERTVEITFLPPGHNRSQFGVLAPYTNVSLSDDELREAREQGTGWAEAAREKMQRIAEQEAGFDASSGRP